MKHHLASAIAISLLAVIPASAQVAATAQNVPDMAYEAVPGFFHGIPAGDYLGEMQGIAIVEQAGCSLVQGYIFGRPMPAEEARELAAKGSASLPDAHLTPPEARIRIIRAALLHYMGQVKGARLRNISSGGALVEAREEIPVGSEIQLDFGAGGLIDATVRWTKGTQFGVQFKEKFDLRLLQLAKPAPSGPKVVTPSYLTAGEAGHGK